MQGISGAFVSIVTSATALAACGGAQPTATGPALADAAAGATRWVPDHPTYVLSAHTVRDAERAARDLASSFGLPFGGVRALSQKLFDTIALDPLNADALAAIGVDLDAGFAMFSEHIDPTFVVRLATPEQFVAFIDRQRERGLQTQSVVIDGVEVFTTKLPAISISWALAGNWLWLHLGGADTGTAWFAPGRASHPAAWLGDLAWATPTGAGGSAVTGFLRIHDLLALTVEKLPAAAACAHTLGAIDRIGVSIDGDGHRAGGSLAFDLGPKAASAIAASVLHVPAGWDAATNGAALALQWNLDLTAVLGTVKPCTELMGTSFQWLAGYGIRAGRAAVMTFSTAGPSGSGAVSLELSNRHWISTKLDELLDQVPGPLRALADHGHRFGPYDGHRFSVPMVGALDYVLTDEVAAAAVGDGLLDKVIGPGGSVPGVIASIDISPSALSADDWRSILGVNRHWEAELIAAQLLLWHSGHLALRVDRDRLVLEAHGDRR